MYKITLSDGTIIECQGLNGNNYISRTELTPAMFAGKLSHVTVDGPYGHEEHGPMKLVQVRQYGGEWWLILADLTPAELRDQEIREENKLLREQVRALTGQNGFLEDCIAEMATTVYA